MIVNDDNGRLSGVRFVIVFHKMRMRVEAYGKRQPGPSVYGNYNGL